MPLNLTGANHPNIPLITNMR